MEKLCALLGHILKFAWDRWDLLLLRLKKYHTPRQRRIHIVDGDATGGGHGGPHGDLSLPSNVPTRVGNKTYFPRDWSHSDIISAAEEAAGNSHSARILQPNGNYLHPPVPITRNSITVEVRVVTKPDARVWTAWPIV